MNPTAYGPTPTGVTISCIVVLESTREDRPASVFCTSITNFARSVAVVQSPAAACWGNPPRIYVALAQPVMRSRGLFLPVFRERLSKVLLAIPIITPPPEYR